jgi:hypothetical protein
MENPGRLAVSCKDGGIDNIVIDERSGVSNLKIHYMWIGPIVSEDQYSLRLAMR